MPFVILIYVSPNIHLIFTLILNFYLSCGCYVHNCNICIRNKNAIVFSEETINHSQITIFAWMKGRTTKNYRHTWKRNYGDFFFLTLKILKKEKKNEETVKLKEEEIPEQQHNRQSNIYTYEIYF